MFIISEAFSEVDLFFGFKIEEDIGDPGPSEEIHCTAEAIIAGGK